MIGFNWLKAHASKGQMLNMKLDLIVVVVVVVVVGGGGGGGRAAAAVVGVE